MNERYFVSYGFNNWQIVDSENYRTFQWDFKNKQEALDDCKLFNRRFDMTGETSF